MKSHRFFAGCLTVAVALALGGQLAAQDPETPASKRDVSLMHNDLNKKLDMLLVNQRVTSDKLDREVDRLNREIAQLRSDLTRLRGERQEKYYDPAPGTGNLRFTNTMNIRARVRVDGETYTIEPGRSRTFPVNAGTVSYYVGAPGRPWSERESRLVVAGRTRTVEIFDPLAAFEE